MSSKEYNFSLGEEVTLPRQTTPIKESGITSFEHLIYSRYICIRESKEGQRGILVRVLGKIPHERLMVKGGEPFCKDDRAESFQGVVYYSYQFPTLDSVKEVLDILRRDQQLVKKFDRSKMHINPWSSFWVRETLRHMVVMRKPQYYDSKSDKLVVSNSNSDEIHYRLSVVYFYKSKLFF